MIEITIPGHQTLKLSHLVLDYNGTLALDGKLLNGVRERLETLSDRLQIHVVTADTFGNARSHLSGLPCQLVILPVETQDAQKRDYITQLGSETTVCLGNGCNDRLMLKAAALGIAVIEGEGAAVEAILASDIVCPDIGAALDLLENPMRLIATLRV